jgi:hypothetical protein
LQPEVKEEIMPHYMRFVVLMLSVLLFYPVNTFSFFEDMLPGARARAMGGAYTAVADDGLAIFYNPAGLTQSRDVSLGGEYHQPFSLSFLRYSHFWLTASLQRFGSFGIALQDRNTSVGGECLERENTLSVSHGFHLAKDGESTLSVGYSLNLYYLSFAETGEGFDPGSAWTAGLDLGFFATLHDRSRAGILVKNINRPRFGEDHSFPLPQWIAAGIAYAPFPMVVTSLELKKEIDRDVSVHGGGEFMLLERIRLRAGIETNPTRFSGGIGFCGAGIAIDYAYAGHAVLSDTHYIGFSMIPERMIGALF